jgi:acyl-CoA hydrolase
MESIEYKIFEKIKKCGRGKEYLASDFATCGESKSVLKALANLEKKQTLIKLATGIYYYPKIDKKLLLSAKTFMRAQNQG